MELKEVFEPIINFLKNFQKKDKDEASKNKAKERLQLVLMQDRASVSPDFFEMMKKEIIEVIKKYIEIDEEALEVELTRGLEGQEGMGPALIANIPIKNIKPVAKKVEVKDGEEDPNVVAQAIIEEIKTVSEEKLAKEPEAETVKEEKIDKKEETKKEETVDANANIEQTTTTPEAKPDTVTQTTEQASNENVQKAETQEAKSDLKDKINNVKEEVTETISNVKNKAKEGVNKIKSKTKAKAKN